MLENRWNRSKDWVGNLLKHLEELNMIKRLSNAGQTILHVISDEKEQNSGRNRGHLNVKGNDRQLRIPEVLSIANKDSDQDTEQDSDQDSEQDNIEEDKESLLTD
jgi:hypothetical protein